MMCVKIEATSILQIINDIHVGWTHFSPLDDNLIARPKAMAQIELSMNGYQNQCGSGIP